MKPFAFALALLFSILDCTCGLAQIPYGSPRSETATVGLTDLTALDQLMYNIPGIGSPTREALVRQNIKSYMMPIRTCPTPELEWAYALTAATEYYLNLNNNFKDNLSPDYLAMNLRAQNRAVTVVDGLNLLVKQGTVSASIVPYGSTEIPRAVYAVPKFQIANFGYLFQPETRGRNRVFETKKALSRGNPVVVEMRTDATFANLRAGQYTPSGPLTETHYLTVVGYDGETDEFELRGGFGRLWGGAGYVRLSYEDFGEMTTNGYVLIPKL